MTDKAFVALSLCCLRMNHHTWSVWLYATPIFLSRTWLPSTKTMVVLEVKYILDSFTYSESVVQLDEL